MIAASLTTILLGIATQEPAHRGWIWKEPPSPAPRPTVGSTGPVAPDPPPAPKPERAWGSKPIVLRDIDGDGAPDVLLHSGAWSTDAAAWVFSGHTGAILATTHPPRWALGGVSSACGRDLDGDGWEDWIAVGTAVGITLSSRTGEPIGEPWTTPCDGTWSPEGDFDGDGITDFLVCRWRDRRIRVVSGSDGRVLHGVCDPFWTPTCSSTAISIGDRDGDGTRDIVIATEVTARHDWIVSLLSSRDGWSARTIARLRAPEGITLSNPGDLDGDGIEELAIAEIDEGVCVLSGCTGNTLFRVPRRRESPDFMSNGFGQALGAFVDPRGRAYILIGVPDDYEFSWNGIVERWSLDERRTRLVLPSPPQDDNWHFGALIETLDDLDRDGVPDFLVGPDHAYCGQRARLYACSGASGDVIWSAVRTLDGVDVVRDLTTPVAAASR